MSTLTNVNPRNWEETSRGCLSEHPRACLEGCARAEVVNLERGSRPGASRASRKPPPGGSPSPATMVRPLAFPTRIVVLLSLRLRDETRARPADPPPPRPRPEQSSTMRSMWKYAATKMGLRKKTPSMDPALTRPRGLYDTRDVDLRKLKRLILAGKLAPCYAAEEARDPDEDPASGADDSESRPELEECPICFLGYPCLNRSKCCASSICTECFLQVKAPEPRLTPGAPSARPPATPSDSRARKPPPSAPPRRRRKPPSPPRASGSAPSSFASSESAPTREEAPRAPAHPPKTRPTTHPPPARPRRRHLPLGRRGHPERLRLRLLLLHPRRSRLMGGRLRRDDPATTEPRGASPRRALVDPPRAALAPSDRPVAMARRGGRTTRAYPRPTLRSIGRVRVGLERQRARAFGRGSSPSVFIASAAGRRRRSRRGRSRRSIRRGISRGGGRTRGGARASRRRERRAARARRRDRDAGPEDALDPEYLRRIQEYVPAHLLDDPPPRETPSPRATWTSRT